MRVIFDLGHPAHFHLFKNVIYYFIKSGHGVEIVAREKDCLIDLLNKSSLDYKLVTTEGKSLFAKLIQNIKAFKIIYSLAKKTKVDFIIGTSLVAPYVARLTSSKSMIFSEDDANVIPIFKKFVYPLSDYIVTPDSLNKEDYGNKHLKYHGYHELAYLHPSVFQPDKSIKKDLGLREDEKFFLIRLVSLTAHHDIGQKGLSTGQALKLVDELKQHGKVFISSERVIDKKLENHLLKVDVSRIFDVISAADMVIGDSQTMIAEAAALGTPSIRCNSFVGRLAYLEELEHKYGLTVGIVPSDFGKLLTQINNWLSQRDLKQTWQQKRQVMLNECVDLTDWVIKFFNKCVE